MKIKLSVQDELRLQMLKSKIDCEYSCFDFTLPELCKQYKLSDHKLRYGFERLNGVSIVEYQAKKRLQHIIDMIKNKNVSLLEAAYDAGFQEYSTFYRLFKREFKVSPGKWRKMNFIELR